MTRMWLVAHALSIAHGLAAALISIAILYVAGLAFVPRRWQSVVRWPDCILFSLAVYVLLCWVATTSRNIPLTYVLGISGIALWGAIALRFRSLQGILTPSLKGPELRSWFLRFSVLYLFAYMLVRPPAAPLFLSLPPNGSDDLVTYARYAKHLMWFGTANVDLTTFEYLRSPASAFLLAWHSLLFLGEPLDAATPALFMVAALFGMIASEIARTALGLSMRAAGAIAGVAIGAPLFRWALATYALGELMAATCVVFLVWVVSRFAASRRVTPELIASTVAGGVVLFFAAGVSFGWVAGVAGGIADVARQFSPIAIFGLPSSAVPEATTDELRAAVVVLLPFVAIVWSGIAASVLRGAPAIDRFIRTPTDRQLVRALIAYTGAAVIIGNVAVEAHRPTARQRWTAAWRQFSTVGRMPFRALTLKVPDLPNGLSTALSLYYMPGRKADVIGRGIAVDRLPFENVSRQEPIFIHQFGCEGVGHDDAVSVAGVGCLLTAPPSMTLGTAYPFNRTFLFMDYDRMTAREPGGRWNTDPTLNIRLTADAQRAQLSRALFINFLVNPFLAPELKPLRLVVRWGKDRRGEFLLREREWLSIPVTSADWRGNRLWTIPIAIDFPDGRTMLFHEVALTESPRGRVVETTPAV